MSFTVLKDDIFFVRQKSSDQKNGNYIVLLSLVSTIRGTKLKMKTLRPRLQK